MACISSESGRDGCVSALTVSPTGPLVSPVSTGRIARIPSATSAATTPSEMIQIASLVRRKARPKASDTVSIRMGRAGTPLAMRNCSTTGPMTDCRVGISTGYSCR
ncbi:hypothetical protein D3C78_1449900 [compost metagenome]